MSLTLPSEPTPGPTLADVIASLYPGVDIDQPGPGVIRDLALKLEEVRGFLGLVRTGVLSLSDAVDGALTVAAVEDLLYEELQDVVRTAAFEAALTEAKDRGQHAGTQAQSTITGLVAALGAAVNRANHTGTQPASTVTGLATVATSGSAADLTGTLPAAALPPLAINDTYPVVSEAAMLALTAQRGDVAVRTDLTPARMFMLTADGASTLGNWREITAAGAVVSVAGRQGAVTLAKGDVGLGAVDNTSDAAKPVSTAQAAAIAAKLDASDPSVTNSRVPTDAGAAALVQDPASQTRLAIKQRFASQVTPQQFGAVGDNIVNDTAALNNWLAEARNTGQEAYLPPGNYKSAPGLAYPAEGARIRGAGRGLSTIRFATSDEHGLTVGPGPDGPVSSIYPWIPGKSFGYVRGLSLYGPTAAPTKNNKAALRINTLRYCQLEDIQAENYDMGFDFQNNCYGLSGKDLQGGSYASCNVGINLRNGDGSGSDLPFFNCWVGGAVAGVHIAGGGGGFHFYGGQISTSSDNSVAAVVLGKDYETGTVSGSHNVSFDGIDFEGFRGYAFHSYNNHPVRVVGSSFFATQTGAAAANGLLWAENPQGSKWHFTNNVVRGVFLDTKLLKVTGTQQHMFEINEEGWLSDTPSSFNGVSAGSGGNWLTSMQHQADTYYGHARWKHGGHATASIDGHLLRRGVSGALETADRSALFAPAGSVALRRVVTAAHTAELTDVGKVIEVDSATPAAVTIPANATTPLPLGALLTIGQRGAGAASFAAASGVTLRGATTATTAQYQELQARQSTTNEWWVV